MKTRKFLRWNSIKMSNIEYKFLRATDALKDIAKTALEVANCDVPYETDDSYHFEDLVLNSISNLTDLIQDLKDELSGSNEESLTYALNNKNILVKLSDVTFNQRFDSRLERRTLWIQRGKFNICIK